MYLHWLSKIALGFSLTEAVYLSKLILGLNNIIYLVFSEGFNIC